VLFEHNSFKSDKTNISGVKKQRFGVSLSTSVFQAASELSNLAESAAHASRTVVHSRRASRQQSLHITLGPGQLYALDPDVTPLALGIKDVTPTAPLSAKVLRMMKHDPDLGCGTAAVSSCNTWLGADGYYAWES